MKIEPYLVSILVPVYGVENYIERCAISLLEQTYNCLEYIFVDDCTKDRSIDILLNVIDRYPKRKAAVKIITHDYNRGLGAARNTAVNSAKGSFIMHVDSDDWIESNAVELCVQKQIETQADYVLMDSVQLHSSWKVTCHIPFCETGRELAIAMLSWKSVWNIWGGLIRHSIYQKNNIAVEEGVNMSEDLQVTPRLAYFSQKVAQVGQVLYNYDCTRENQYTHLFSIKNHRQTLRTLEILTDFFVKNDPTMLDYVYIMKINILANNIKNISRVKGKSFDQYYSVLLKHLEQIPHKYWDCVSMPERIMFYLRFRKANQIYVYLAGKIKHWMFSEHYESCSL